MNQRPSLNRRLRLVLLFGLFLTVAFTVSTSGTGSAPFLVATSTVAKPGEEVVGTGITYGNSGVYFSAFWHPANDEAEALVGTFAAPMPNGALPAWSRGWPGGAGFDAFMGADVGADGVYYAGASYSQTSDSVGGKERKEIVAKFNLDGTAGADTGGAAWVGRQRFYPGSNSYDGDEFFNTARVSVEGGTTYFYGAGRAQSNGCNSTYAIRKYTASGATSWQWQQTNGACGGSEFNAIVVNGSDVYAAGSSSYAGNLPQILQFSASSGSAGPSATFSGTLDGYLSGTYTSMAVYGGNIYAAGYLTSGERQAYLLDEWNTSGTRLVHQVWSSDATKANSQQLTGITAVGSRLFVTGWTRDLDNPATAHNMGGPTTPVFLDNSAYHGFGDGVIFEINPANGDVVSTTTYGMNDAKDQAFTGVTTDGTDLYVVGGERDASGFYHVIVQRYGLSVATTLVNVSASGSYGGQATLQATLSSSGAPISGATVNFTVSGNPAGSAVTDANGLAQVTNVSLAGVNAGGYPGVVGATFTATGNFLGSSATGDLTVNKAGAAISVTVPGTSLVSGQLHAPYNGQAHPAVGAVRGVLVPTDSLGAATITYTDLDTIATSSSAPVNAGSYRVNASFAGNTNYVSGSNNSVTFTIDQASTSTALQIWSPFAPTGTGPAFGSYGSAEFNDGAGHVIVVSADSSNPFVLSAGSGLGGTPSWTSPTASGSHPVQKNAAAAYDPASNSVMMYGGCSSGCTPITNQVWVLSNANGVGGTPTWINRTPASSPAPRQAMARGYDPTSNQLIIFGGQDGGGSGGSTYPEIWVLTNANGSGGNSLWSQLTPGNPAATPPGQWGPSSWYDPASNRLIVAGGGAYGSGTLTRAVWALTNANGLGGTPQWINLIPEGAAGSPNGFVLWPAAYDAATNRAMLFETGTSNIWVITNANGLGGTPTYNHVTLTGGPSSLTDNVEMAYDAANHRLTVIPSASQIFVLGSADGTGSINPSTYGQPVTFTATVSPIAPGSGTRTGTVTFKDGAATLGTGTVDAGGQTTFTTSLLSASGSPHSITAVYSGDTNFFASTSSTHSQNVIGGAPHHLTFAQQPSNAVAGSAISPSVKVRIEDAFNNLTTSTASVTLAIATNPGGGTLGGTATVNAVGGEATFSGLSITKAGTGYTLRATSASLAQADSTAFNIIPAPATTLAFTTQPGNGTGGSTLTSQSIVTIQDAFGNTVTTATNSITLAIGTNPSGGTLSANVNPLNAVGGVATFAAVRIDKAGNAYTLTAAASGLATATSTPFNITVGAPNKIVGTTQVGGAVVGAPLTPQPVVTIQDAGGNTVTTSSMPIRVFLGQNPTGATLGGTSTVSATAGVATFTGLSVNKVGTGYRMNATCDPGCGGLFDISLGLFNVTAANTTTALSTNPAPVYGSANVTLSATVTANSPSTAIVDEGTVSFTVKTASNVTIGSVNATVTNGSATASYALSGMAAGTYSVLATYVDDAASPNFNASAAVAGTLTVVPSDTTTTVTSSANPSVFGQSVTFTSTVTPLPPGAGTPTGTVTFKDGASTLGSGALNGVAQATFTTNALSVGGHAISAVYGASTNFATSTSSVLTQTVNQISTATSLLVLPGSWQTKATMPTARNGLAGEAINGVIYLAGGWNGGHLTTVEAYNPATNTWTTKANRPSVQTHAATGVINGKMYTAGGTNTSVEINDLYEYTPGTDAWVSKLAMPTTRQQAAGGVLNNRLYVAGGLNSVGAGTQGTFSTLEEYDPISNTWATKASMPTARRGAGGAVSGGLFYVIGGQNASGTALNIVEAYDPATNAWSTKAPMPTPRDGFSVTESGGLIFAVGGETGSTRLDAVEAYNPATNTWATYSPFTARNYFKAVAVNGTIYAIGGTSDAQPQATGVNQAYTPPSAPTSSTFGQSITLTATVNAVAPGTGTAAGAVTFRNGADVVGTATLNSKGVATLTTSTLAIGNYALTAEYAGGGNFAASTSSSASHSVTGTPTTTTLGSAPNPSTFAQSVTFTATVAGSGGTPTGTVDFKEGGTTLGTGSMSGGVTTFVTSSLSLGGHSITAVYSGDANFLTSTSSALSQTVNPAPPPTSVFTANPNPAACSQNVAYDGSGSFASPGLNVVSYAWNFGDGTTGAGSTITHAYSAFGAYSATLTVTDNNVPAKTGAHTVVVNVNQGNHAPVAVHGGPYLVDLGAAATLDGTASNDADTSCGDSIATYSWSIGAITLTGASPTLTAAQINSLGVGSFAVSLTVTDTFGVTGTASTTLSIYNNVPTASFTATPNPAACSQTITFNGSASTAGRPDRAIVSYAWNFGDGATATGATTTHAYSAFGVYTAKLTVTDSNVPAKTAFTTVAVNVNQGNQAPVANAGGPYSATLGGGVALNGSGSSDPNAACGDSIVSYSWTIDAGAITATGQTPSLTAAQISSLGVGLHNVSLTVTDGLGAMGNASTSLTVADSIASVSVTPSLPTIPQGGSQTFTATAIYASGATRVLATDSWTSGAPLAVASYGPGAAVVNGQLYVISGFVTQRVAKYNPTNNTWTNLANLPVSPLLQYFGTAVIGTKIYVVGGDKGGSGQVATLYAYETTTNTWITNLPAMPGGARYSLSAAALNGKLYAVGGVDSANHYLARVEVYDPTTNSWSTLGTGLSVARLAPAVGAIGGRLYAAGGNTPSGAVGTLDIYDPTTNTWTTGASMPTPRDNPGAVAGGQLWVVGSGPGENQVHSYSPVTNTWTQHANLPTARHALGVAADDSSGKVFAVGGYNNGYQSALEILQPAEATWSSGTPAVASMTAAGVATGIASGTSVITATMLNGLSGNTTLTVSDNTAPTTTATPSPAPSAAAWNNTNVTVTLNATDNTGGSGVQSIVYSYNGNQNGGPFTVAGNSASVSITVDGTTTVNYHAIDNSGNVESDHAISINIDKAAPFLSYPSQVQTQATSSAGASVTFSVSASDSLSGLLGSISVTPKASGETFPVGTTTEHVTATDKAGNTANAFFDVVVTPNRPNIVVTGGTFSADDNPHPATATATDSFGATVPGTFSFAYVPGGSAPVAAGRYSAAASFTSASPAFTNASPWTTMAPDPHAKSSPSVAEINGKLYVQGFDQDPNGNQSSFVPRLSIYDPASNTWTIGASPSLIRGYASAGAIGGKLYVVGGCVLSDCGITTNVLEIYDPAHDTWSSGASMPTGRFGAAAGVIGGKLYVTGGSFAPYIPTNVTEIYDPVSNTWTTGAPIPASRELPMSAVLNGELYVIGGYQRDIASAVARVDVYNPVTGWSTRSAKPSSSWGGVAGVLGVEVYVVGGWAGTGGLLATNESYDPASNTWTSQIPMPTARTYVSGGVVNGRLYAIDGYGATLLGTNEVFDPSLTARITINAALAPPTLTVSPTTAVKSTGSNFTFSGTGVLGATVSLFDGTSPFQGGTPVDGTGNWSSSFSVDSFLVGSHTMTAKQSSGGQTSVASTAVTIHVRPSVPGINSPNSVTSSTSPASVTLTGFGFYGGGQTPPTGSTVTIFEGQTVLGTAVVGSNGQWSATVQLAYGSHTLTASQTLAGETSELSSSFPVTVGAPIAPPTLTASPTTVVQGNSITFSGTGVSGANVSLFDGANNIGGGIPVDGTGNWSASRSGFIVGSHTITAKQSSGTQNSSASTAVVVHIRPQAPGISSPSSVSSSTSPATVALTGFGFYGGAQTPPTGSTVTIFEGQTMLGTAVVTSSGQWSATVSLTYGSHTLRASQTLAGETSDLSTAFTITVTPTLVSVSVSPSTASITVGASRTFQAMGHFSDGSSQQLLSGTGGTGGTFTPSASWSVYFSPQINVSACATGSLTFISQTFMLGTNGTIDTIWAPGNQVLHVHADGTGNTSLPSTLTLNLSCNNAGTATGTITATFNPATARHEGTFTFNNNASTGNVVITGWNPASTMPTARSAAGAATINDVLYVVGGMTNGPMSTVQAFDPLNTTTPWTTKAAMPTARAGAAVAVQAGTTKLFAIGGNVVGGGVSGVVEVYDASTNQWSTQFAPSVPLAPMPTLRMGAGAAEVNGKIYVPGGTSTSGSSALASMDVYDIASNTWSSGPAMSTARNAHGMASFNGIVYVFGGNQGSTGSTVEAYDPSTNQWSSRRSLPSGGGGFAAAVMPAGPSAPSPTGGLIYVSAANSSLQVYDTYTDTWVILSPTMTSRSQVAAGAIGRLFYAVGGMPFGTNLQSSVGTNEVFSTSGDPGPDFAGLWQLQFTPSLDLSACGAGLLSSRTLIPVPSGAFQIFGVGSGQITRTTFALPISCGSLAGNLSASGGNGLFQGSYTVGSQTGTFSVTLQTFVSGGGTGSPSGGSSSSPTVQWQSTNPSVAGIDSSGRATGIAPGQTTILATASNGVSCTTTATCATLTVNPPAYLTFALEATSVVFPSVNVTVTDPTTGQSKSFDVNIGAPQTLDPGSYHLLFTPPTGYTVTPTYRDFTIQPGDNLTITLRFAPTDTTAPVLTVSPDLTAEATSSAGAPVTFAAATATDADSGVASVSCDRASGSTFPLGDTIVHCTAADNSGNTASASFHVTVVDTTNPAITAPANVTAEATSSDGATVNPGQALASDLAGTPLITRTPTGNQFPLGTTLVVWRATDASGNFSEATQQVTVVDTTPPTITAPPDVTAEATGPYGTVVNPGQAVVSDLVGPVTISVDGPAQYPLGMTTIIWTATDAAGNHASATQHVTVVDTTKPTITAPANVTAEATGSNGATVDPGQATASDLVSSVTITRTPASNQFALGTWPIVWRATDGAGNFSEATQQVTVVDTTKPTITAPPNVTSELTGPNGATVDPGQATASDLAGAVTITRTPASNQFALGTSPIVWRATDGAGNFSEATQQVTVVDTTNPTITAPANVTAEATGPNGATVSPGQAAASDLAGAVTITRTPTGNQFAVGSTEITWKAIDAAGNFSTATQQVTVVDTTGPSVSVPANIIAEGTSSSGAVVTFSVSATDLVDGPTAVTCTPASGSTFAFGTTPVNCTSNDVRNNPGTGSFTVTVRDTVAPVVTLLTPSPNDFIATAPSTVTVDVQVVDAGGASAVTINGVSATNVGPTAQGMRWRATVTGPAAGAALTITANATDRGGLQGSTSAVFDNDGIERAIDRGRTTGADQSGVYSSEFNDGTTAGVIQRFASAKVTAVRNGGAVRVTLVSAGTAQIQACTGNVKYVVLDAVGESADISCAATGTVTVTGRGPGTIELYKQTPDSVMQAYLRCESFSMFLPLGIRRALGAQCSASPSPVSYYYAYRISLKDGETASTGSPVTASPDNTEPIHVLLVQIEEDTGNQVEVGSFDLDPGESADVSVTPGANREDLILFSVLNGSVTVTIGDVTQTVSAGQQVTVGADLMQPTVAITSPSALTTSDSPIMVSVVFSEPVAGFDATRLVLTNATVSGFAGSGAVYTFALIPNAPGAVTAAIPGALFTDLAGNVNVPSAVFTRTFTWSPPVVTTSGDVTVEATSPNGAVATFNSSAVDAGGGSTDVTCVPQSGSTFPLGTTTVACSSTDRYNNTGSRSFSVKVVDTTKPTLTLPANISTSATSFAGAPVAFTASALDLVDGVRPIICSPASGSTFAIGATTVSCTSADTRGNSAARTFTVTVTFNFAQARTLLLTLISAVRTGNTAAACSQLAGVIPVIQAQVGSRLTQAEATVLIRLATDARRSLGCP